MKKEILVSIFMFALLILGCSNRNMIHFKWWVSSDSGSAKITYRFELPKGFSVLHYGGYADFDYSEYSYPDSTEFYIGRYQAIVHNYENLLSKGLSNLNLNNEDWDVSGVDDEKHWREVSFYNEFRVGFINANPTMRDSLNDVIELILSQREKVIESK